MLKLALAQLGELGAGDERQDDVCGEAFLERGFDAQGVCGVDEDAGMLGGDDGIDDGGEIVDIGKSFYA